MVHMCARGPQKVKHSKSAFQYHLYYAAIANILPLRR